MSNLRTALRLLGKLAYMRRGFDFGRNFPHLNQAAPAAAPNPNPLRDFFERRKTGRGVWKWLHYFDIYQRHLAKFVGRPVTIAEVGIYSGGSLEMWREYFGQQCSVVGVDLQAACKAYENDHTRVLVGDQADRAFWSTFRREVPELDVLVDDGGHRAEQQIVTLEEVLPHLRPGGVFLCEDVHGEHHGFNAYVAGLVKNLNAMNGPTPFQRWTLSVHLYPFVTVIEKAAAPVERIAAEKHGTDWAPFKTS